MTSFDQSDLLQWGDVESEWLDLFETTSPNRKVLIDNSYVYLLTVSGINIIDLATEYLYAFAPADSYTCFAQNDTSLFIGTYTRGLKYLSKSTISGSILEPCDISTFVTDYQIPLTASKIYDVSCTNNHLCCTTGSGVDHVNLLSKEYSFTTTSGTYELCHQRDSGVLFYTSGGRTTVNKVESTRWDWDTTTASYYFDGLTISSMCYDGTYLYVGTNDGLFVCDNSQILIDSSYLTIDILTGESSNNVVSTSYNMGRVYASTDDSVIVIDAQTGTLADYYTSDRPGASNTTLQDKTIVSSSA